jgi:hypothetical protein
VRRSRELLDRMQLEPGRHKFMRLPVANLGQGGCGAWEVRPRLGLIGMLAGWWHVKLSSGCPLPKGRAAARPEHDQADGMNWPAIERPSRTSRSLSSPLLVDSKHFEQCDPVGLAAHEFKFFESGG